MLRKYNRSHYLFFISCFIIKLTGNTFHIYIVYIVLIKRTYTHVTIGYATIFT